MPSSSASSSLSLALITVSFRSPPAGALHGVQNVGAAAMRPFEVAADRVARPFRDAYGWFDGLAGAKSENQKLKQELARAAAAVTRPRSRPQNENAQLQRLLHFERGPSVPEGLPRGERERASSARRRDIAAAGHDRRRLEPGVRVNTPVVTRRRPRRERVATSRRGRRA